MMEGLSREVSCEEVMAHVRDCPRCQERCKELGSILVCLEEEE